MFIFKSEAAYIESCASLEAKIAGIDNLIAALLVTGVKSATTDNISEYWLNDGQTQIKTIYRGTASITKSITELQNLRNLFVNQLTGRKIKLVDGKTFMGNGYC